MALIKLNPWGRRANQPLGASENIQNALGNGMLTPVDTGAKIVRGPIFTRIVKVVALAAVISQAPVNLLASTLGTQTPVQAPFSQSDWPNPVVRKPDTNNRTWLQQLNLNLLGKDKFFGEAGQPPANLNQPNPQRAKRVAQDQSQNLLESTLAPAAPSAVVWGDYYNTFAQAAKVRNSRVIFGTAAPEAPTVAPFSQTDWPNPTLRKPDVRGAVKGLNLNLIGQDRFFGAAGQPPANTDFPNPKAARRTPQYHNLNLLQSTLTPVVAAGNPFAQDDWPNPTRKSTRPLGVIYHRVAMAAPAPSGPPFAQTEWPNPRGKINRVGISSQLPTNIPTMIEDFVAFSSMQDVPARVSRVAVTSQQQGNLTVTTLSGAPAAPPFSQDDWPNPVIRKQAVRTTVNGVNLNLLSQDQFFGAAGQPPTYDYPNPKAPKRSVQDWNQNLLQSTLVPQPFAQTDWPNPITRKPGIRGDIYSVNLELIGQDSFFGVPGQPPANYDFPNPKAQRRNPQDWLQSPYNSQGEKPFTQYDFPNPRGPKRNPQDWSQNLLQSTLTPAAGTPFSQTDWPNPQRPRRGQDWQYSQAQFIPAPVAGTPFSQTDWPNPVRRVTRPFGAFYHRVAMAAPAQAAGTPFVQTDWQNPLGRANTVARISQQPVNLSTMVEDFIAFSSMQDIPQRTPRVAVTSQQPGINLSLLTTTGQKPFAQTDWQNPIRPKRVQYW